jgi:hypothetical protein
MISAALLIELGALIIDAFLTIIDAFRIKGAEPYQRSMV